MEEKFESRENIFNEKISKRICTNFVVNVELTKVSPNVEMTNPKLTEMRTDSEERVILKSQ